MRLKKYSPPATKRKDLLDNITDEDYAAELVNVENTGRRGAIIRGMLTAAAMLVVAVGITTAALIGREVFHSGKKPLPAATAAKLDYTIVYEPPYKPTSAAYYDYSDRIIVTDEADTIEDDRKVTERDVVTTLKCTGFVTQEDLVSGKIKSLCGWYLKDDESNMDISDEPVTVLTAQGIANRYVKEHLYLVDTKAVDDIFLDYDSNSILTHKHFKQIVSDLTALLKTAGFGFDIDADDVSEISITPSRNYFRNDYDDFLAHCITLTDEKDIADTVKFLNDIKFLKGEYSDEVITGNSDTFTVFDNDGNKVCSFIMYKDDYIRVSATKCFYTLEEGYFSKVLEKIVPKQMLTVNACYNLFNLLLIENSFSAEAATPEWYQVDNMLESIDADTLSDMTETFFGAFKLKNNAPDIPKDLHAETIREYIEGIGKSLYIDLPDECYYAIVNGCRIEGDELARLIKYIEDVRISKLSVRPVATGVDYNNIGFYTDNECIPFDYTQSALMSADIGYALPTEYLTAVYKHNRDFSGEVYLTVDGKKIPLSDEDAELVRDMISGSYWKEYDTGLECDMTLTVGKHEFGYYGEGRSLTYEHGHIEMLFGTSQRLHQLLSRYIN